MKIIIDVDFDYFARENPALMFSHSDRFSGELAMMLWLLKATPYIDAGCNLIDLMRSPHDVAPDDFWDSLSEHRVFARSPEDTSLLYCDSHVGIGSEILDWLEVGTEYELFHFDAHHDLFYGEEKDFWRSAWQGEFNCGNWLGVVAASDPHRRIRRIHIVYPEWRRRFDGFPEGIDFVSLPEDKQALFSCHETDADRQSRFTEIFADLGVELFWWHWDDWLRVYSNQADPAPPHLITTCLSSPWTPPWMDLAFERFIQSAPAQGTLALGDHHWGDQGFSPRLLDGKPWPDSWEELTRSPSIVSALEGNRMLSQLRSTLTSQTP